MADLSTYGAIDDCPHLPENDDTFQESALFVWHDLDAGVGGFWRIGQEVVVGKLNSCFGIFTADGARFRSNVSGEPMMKEDRSETHMSWGSKLRVDLDRLAIQADFPELQASLTFEDFHPRLDHHTLVGGERRTEHAKGHFEVAGRMTGRILIDGREIRLNALGYRDRSWGPRKWGTLRSTRWWPVVFGPDLSAHLVTVVDEAFNGAFGYVLRDGIAYPMSNIKTRATLEDDALTPHSAIATFDFGNGESGEFVHTPADGIVMHVRGYTAIESIGAVRWGDRLGMSNFELSNNPGGGTKPPLLVTGGNMVDGFTRR